LANSKARSYADNVAGRALERVVHNDLMHIQLCGELATSGGYKYFGLEFGKIILLRGKLKLGELETNWSPTAVECWLGNELNPSSTPADPTTCNKICRGSSNQICGGADRINIYTAETVSPLTCTRVANPNVDTLACGIRGFAAPAGSTAATTNESTAECASLCSRTSGCASYAYNKDSKACSLYAAGVWASVGGIASQAGSDYSHLFLDDIGCWACE
jgi:hypothetical protein